MPVGDPDAAAEKLSIVAEGAAEWTPAAEVDPNHKEPEQKAETPPRFQFIHNAAILADLRPVEWRIRDILTDCALYYHFGDPGRFKEQLGHSSIQMTVDICGHLIPGSNREAVNRLDSPCSIPP